MSRIPATPALPPQDSPEASTAVGAELSTAQRALVDEYVREMTGIVIPEIVRVVEERRKLASLSRQMPLKVGS